MKIENIAIVVGAVAVAYVLNKAYETKKAMSSLTGYSDTQYGGYADDIKGNTKADKIIWV